MNRKQGVAIAGVALVGVYVATSWGLGRMIHARFDGIEPELAKQPVPLLTLAEHKHSRGVFSSVETMTFEIDRDLWNALVNPASAAEASEYSIQEAALEDEESDGAPQVDPAISEPLRFTLTNHVQHGPFPGFTSIGAARIDSALTLDEAAQKRIAAVLGDRAPLTMATLVGFTGASRIHLSSPAFEVKDGASTIVWRGVEGRFTHGRDVSTLTCDVSAPGLDVTIATGEMLQIGQMNAQCDLKRAFGDLFAGTSSMSIAAVKASFKAGTEALNVADVRYAGDVVLDGEYVNAVMRFSVGTLNLPDFKANALEYDMAFNHLHGPTYASLMAKIDQMGAATATETAADPAAMMNTLTEDLAELLDHSPEIIVKKIGFSMPEGSMAFSGSMRLKDFTKAEMQQSPSPLAVLPKIHVAADVWFDAALLDREWFKADEAADEGAPTPEQRAAALRSQVAQMEEAGLLTRKDDRLESHLEFKDGQFLANGKPLSGGM